MLRRLILAVSTLAAAALGASAVSAQVVLFTPEVLHGVIDLRAAAADGEPSFEDGGFGKAIYGGDGTGAFKGDADLAMAALEWTPRFGWDWSAVVDVGHQPDEPHGFGLLQAYAVFKPTPRSATRFKARIGYFYPPISLENDARVWEPTDVITPSAIDSWIGEEVKVMGAEGSVSHAFGAGKATVTGALFGYDDTAGTLMAFRGWAFDDRQAQLNGTFPLPPLSPFFAWVQDEDTYSNLDIDHRLGYYGKVEWDPVDWPLTLEALYFDNRGDRTGVNSGEQWAWDTRFTNVGMTAQLDEHTRILGQAMVGRTQFGFQTPTGLWVDVLFQSAYLEATRDLGQNSFTLRGDLFDTKDRSMAFGDDKSEHGWGLTGAWRRPLTKHLDVRVEALHVESNRPDRVLAGETPFQSQTVLQSSLRLSF